MADSIPRVYLREITTALAAETLKVAFFVDLIGYTETDATNTYTSLVSGGATEVASNGTTNYTTGGYTLTTTSSNMTGNGAKLTATYTSLASATLSYRYAVIYKSGGNIRFIKDHGSLRSVTSGTITITWDATNGIVNFKF